MLLCHLEVRILIVCMVSWCLVRAQGEPCHVPGMAADKAYTGSRL